jgi:hypothetical protein
MGSIGCCVDQSTDPTQFIKSHPEPVCRKNEARPMTTSLNGFRADARRQQTLPAG